MKSIGKISLLLIIACLMQSALTLFEKEKGLHDWRIENLGEIKELKFIENSNLVYTLSTTGLLTLFDTQKQQIQWKKDLPSSEQYHLRYLSRNLLVYSDKRALLLNSASHVIYDVHLEGHLNLGIPTDSHLAVELFEFQGHIYSCFAKDYKVIIYRDYQQIAILEYTQTSDSKGVPQIKPLEMIFDRKSSKLILLANVEGDGSDSRITTFAIDVIKQSMEATQDKKFDLKGLKSTSRTQKYFALIFEDRIKFLLSTDLEKQVIVKDAVESQLSLLDDIAIIKDSASQYKIRDIDSSKEQSISHKIGCNIKRSVESESIEAPPSEEVVFAKQCEDDIEILGQKPTDATFTTYYRSVAMGTTHHGKLLTLFSSQQDLIIQFLDLSLHYYDNKKTSIRWVREESLSKITQVEVLDQESIRIESELEYVKNVKQEQRLDQVPLRIFSRYMENAQFFIKGVQSMIQKTTALVSSKTPSIGLQGFKKTFLMLSETGKILAVSATDGSVLWTQYLNNNVPKKILVRNLQEREVEGTQASSQQVAVIYQDQICLLNPQTGVVERSYLVGDNKANQMEYIIVQLQKSRDQYILAITNEALSQEKPLFTFPPGELTPELLQGESIYFTHINREQNVIHGYKLRNDLSAQKVWSMNLDKQGEKILRIETQFQTASEIEHLHFMPTAFSGENIIYKYLDSNIFALATVNAVTDDLIVYLVNGVSGKIVYKYFEKKVRLDLPFDMILSENLFILAFQRQASNGLTHQEITVTELYSQRQEDNTKKLLLEYYKGEERLQQNTFSSFVNEQPVIIQETYILPFAVKAIVLTQTQHHITGKNLVVVTHNNLIYQVDHNLFTARRPHSDNLVLSADEPKKVEGQILDLKSKDLPPYDAVIPVNTIKYLSYGLPLIDLKEVLSFPTRFESTTQLLAYGFDIFATRLSPENNFDLLQEYFNYSLLFIFIAGLGITAYVVKRIVQKRTRQNNFLLL